MATRQARGTRAKDTDRSDTCQMLDTALAEGQLSMQEHRQRVSAATRSTTLGDLQALVSDLQTSIAAVQLPKLKSDKPIPTGGWGMKIAVAAVLVLLGMGIGWGIYGRTSSPLSFTADSSDPRAVPDGIAPDTRVPPKEVHSLGGLTGLFDQARQKFGDTMGYGLTIYPDYAVMTRADPNESRRELSYTYRGGWGDPSSSPNTGDDVLVDLAAFDYAAVIAKLRGAPEVLGIKQEDVTNTYLSIGPAKDPTTPGALNVSVYVSSDYGSGYIQLDGAGNVKMTNYP